MAYNPSDHTASNKAYGTRGKPVEARTYFFDKGVTFRYRPYMSLAEVLTNLPTADDRRGNFEVIVNTGGTLQSSGYITGGVNQAYWFRDGLADGNLVIKDTDLSDYYTQEEVNALFDDLSPVASSGSYNDLTDKPVVTDPLNVSFGTGSISAINWNSQIPSRSQTYQEAYGDLYLATIEIFLNNGLGVYVKSDAGVGIDVANNLLYLYNFEVSGYYSIK